MSACLNKQCVLGQSNFNYLINSFIRNFEVKKLDFAGLTRGENWEQDRLVWGEFGMCVHNRSRHAHIRGMDEK